MFCNVGPVSAMIGLRKLSHAKRLQRHEPRMPSMIIAELVRRVF